MAAATPPLLLLLLLLLLLQLLPTHAAAQPWWRHGGLDCFSGRGATDLESPPGSSLGAMPLAECQRRCLATQGCTAVTTDVVNLTWAVHVNTNCYAGHGKCPAPPPLRGVAFGPAGRATVDPRRCIRPRSPRHLACLLRRRSPPPPLARLQLANHSKPGAGCVWLCPAPATPQPRDPLLLLPHHPRSRGSQPAAVPVSHVLAPARLRALRPPSLQTSKPLRPRCCCCWRWRRHTGTAGATDVVDGDGTADSCYVMSLVRTFCGALPPSPRRAPLSGACRGHGRGAHLQL